MGAGNVGGAIARGAARAGHRVVVTANDPQHARQVAEEVGGAAAASAESLNARFRQAARRRGHFPTEQAAMKILYLVANRNAGAAGASPAGSTVGPRPSTP
ncbi:hypothetical protein E1182_22820 [Micromonospora sp. KC721]|nr:hypothetical protein E1182_22820 [Micromonospora sp. KC721]